MVPFGIKVYCTWTLTRSMDTSVGESLLEVALVLIKCGGDCDRAGIIRVCTCFTSTFFFSVGVTYGGPKLPSAATIKMPLQQQKRVCNKKNMSAKTKPSLHYLQQQNYMQAHYCLQT